MLVIIDTRRGRIVTRRSGAGGEKRQEGDGAFHPATLQKQSR